MDRHLLQVTQTLLKLCSESNMPEIYKQPYGPLAELASHLRTVDAATNIPPQYLEKFLSGRSYVYAWDEKLFPLGDDIVSGLQKIKEAVNGALSAPIPLAQSRFPTVLDVAFRDILDRDLLEAEVSFDCQLYKSCIVLSGSILEAALYEYLLRNPSWTMNPNQKNIPKAKGKPKEITKADYDNQWTLNELVKFACANNIITRPTEQAITDLIRQPRNLIHPIKEIRQEGVIDEHTAVLTLDTLKLILAQLANLNGPPA